MPFERQPIPKRIRFEVFKRDRFSCQYCGASPPAVILEIDHINPVSDGGSSEIDNLVTSCFECNRGKAAGSLSTVPPTVAEKAEAIREKAMQLAAYNKLLNDEYKRLEAEVDGVEGIFQFSYPSYHLTTPFRLNIRRDFLSRLPEAQVREALDIACTKIEDDPNRTIKYFCGICWSLIRGKQRG